MRTYNYTLPTVKLVVGDYPSWSHELTLSWSGGNQRSLLTLPTEQTNPLVYRTSLRTVTKSNWQHNRIYLLMSSWAACLNLACLAFTSVNAL